MMLSEDEFDADFYAPPLGYSVIVTTADYEDYMCVFDGEYFLREKDGKHIKNVIQWKYLV